MAEKQVFMDTNAKFYLADTPVSASHCLVPFVSREMQQLLEIATVPVSIDDITEARRVGVLGSTE
jgi:hypothetical protein